MRLGRTSRRTFWWFAAWAAIMLSGCANLGAIRDFGKMSAESAEYTKLVTDYAGTPSRLERYEPASRRLDLEEEVRARQAERDRILLWHKAIQEYMDALGQLAADELTTYDKETDALGKAVKDAKFLNQNEADAFSSLSKVLVTAVTDRWRQRKLAQLIEETNAPFQVVVGALVTIVETGFVTDLSIERAAMNNYYTTRQHEGRDPAGLAALSEWHDLREGQLSDREKAINAYGSVLRMIAAGHQKLYDARHDLSKDSVLAEVHRYAKNLQEAFNAVKALQ